MRKGFDLIAPSNLAINNDNHNYMIHITLTMGKRFVAILWIQPITKTELTFESNIHCVTLDCDETLLKAACKGHRNLVKMVTIF